MKKLGILFATIIMAMLFAVSANALEPTGRCGDDVYWIYDSNTKSLVISGSGDMWDYETSDDSPFYKSNIKSVVIEEGITSIGDLALRDSISLTDIVIPGSVTTIGESAFYGCNNLISIIIPNNVTTIGKNAFYATGFYDNASNWENGVLYIGKYLLEAKPTLSGSYMIKDSTKIVANYAFFYCEYLKSITIPDSVTFVGDYAFYGCCRLADIKIGRNVELGYSPFAFCRGITNIAVDKNSVLYSNDEFGVLFNKNKTSLILYPVANTRIKYEIPNTVTYISAWAFYESSYLEKIVIPESVTEIKLMAFSKSKKLKNITIPGSIKTCEQILTNCESLESIVICEGVINIYENAFTDCYKLKEVTLPNSIKVIDTAAFNRCGLSDVYYYGCQNEWNKIYIENEYGFNDYLVEASIHFIHSHSYIFEITKFATHISEGEITYTCICNDKYTEPIAKLEGHTYTSEVTKEATHTEEGILTFTCECGDTYNEPIARLEEHTYTSRTTKEPTHLEFGETTFSCECGESYTEAIAKLGGHSYVANVILPTCSEKGYTEYLCECGDSYISDYVGMIAHSYVYSVVKPSSHLIEGLGRYTCSKCGDHYDESIAKTKEHSYTSTLVNSTCISQGYTLSECECGDSFKSDYLAKTDHNDSNADGVCDNCGYELTANCSCNCHAGGIKGLIFKLILFFQKLFRMNRICEGCGVYHY